VKGDEANGTEFRVSGDSGLGGISRICKAVEVRGAGELNEYDQRGG
jgi:hypothetical protein